MDQSPQLPLVTAVVVDWNGGAMLEDALASLFAQTHGALEVILVDNGSGDGAARAAATRHGDRLVYLRNDQNTGFAHANNQAFAIARGEWVFLLNNDAIADPAAVAELVAATAGEPDLGMLACRIVRHQEPNIIDSVGLLLYPDGVSRPRGWEEKDLGQYDRKERVLCPHGCAGLFRTSMLRELGGFDEDFFCYLEDIDLGLRAQMLGYHCLYVPTSRVRHRKSASAGNYSKFKAYHVERNRIWVAAKCVPRFILFVSPFFTANRYLMQAYAAYTHQGLSGEFVKEYSYPQLLVLLVRAYVSALWRLPRMLRKRRAISRTRKLTVREWYGLISRYKLDAIELALKY